MLDAHRPVLALRLLVAFQFLQRGQHGPGLAVDEAHEALAATGGRLEGEPGIGNAACLVGLAVDLEVARPGRGERLLQHRGNVVAAFDGLDVPGERDEIAPVAVLAEQLHGLVDVLFGDGGFKLLQPGLDGLGRFRVRHSRFLRLAVSPALAPTER